MKIRQPWLIKAAGFSAAWVLRLWLGTLQLPLSAARAQRRSRNGPSAGDRYIYAFWHENLLLPAYHYGRTGVHVLISQHADGELIAEVCRHLGFPAVRGSPKRGAVKAMRQMVKLARSTHLAITPDGPRGPRRQVQPGLVYLAARTGLPIVPVGFAYDRPGGRGAGTASPCPALEPGHLRDQRAGQRAGRRHA